MNLKHIDRESAYIRLRELHVVDDVPQRKTKMARLSDTFIVLPSRVGT